MTTTKQNNVNGINHLIIGGNPDSDNILIHIPGIGNFKENYIEHLCSFSGQYKTIYAIDFPEQGSKGKWQIGVMVDLLKEFIDTISDKTIKNIDLAGHSAGGIAALSYLLSYNSKVEFELMNLYSSKPDDIDKSINEVLLKSGFASSQDQIRKIRNIILYAPPDTIDVVFKKSISKRLIHAPQKFLYYTTNLFINYPIMFLGIFRSNPYFHFKINKQKKFQYFRLVVENHKIFFQYMSAYKTIFELYPKFNSRLKKKVDEILSSKNIILQYGSHDWLIKPFFGRKTRIIKNFNIDDSILIIKHKYLGHMLNRKLKFDVNMNRQMLKNKDVIQATKNFIASSIPLTFMVFEYYMVSMGERLF